jgi:hypothetical protein
LAILVNERVQVDRSPDVGVAPTSISLDEVKVEAEDVKETEDEPELDRGLAGFDLVDPGAGNPDLAGQLGLTEAEVFSAAPNGCRQVSCRPDLHGKPPLSTIGDEERMSPFGDKSSM